VTSPLPTPAPPPTAGAAPAPPAEGPAVAAAKARDATRKADLQRLAEALLAYHREHGRLPCPGDNVWVSSADGPNWITDGPADCGETADPAPLPSPLPVDPVNEPGPFWRGAHVYSYRAYRSGCPDETRGQYFVLGTLLESPDPSDPAPQARDCTGEVIPWRSGVWTTTVLQP
jgi:hypothetical protein